MRKYRILIIIMILLFVVSMMTGRFELSFDDIMRILMGTQEDAIRLNVFLKIRLPRTIFVILAGGALSLSGFVYQSIFRNPLVSPDILGVSSGASVGAIFAILFIDQSVAGIQIMAFVAGIVVVIIAVMLSKLMRGQRIYAMIISGIIIGALSNSAIMVLKYIADPERQLATIDYWLMGSFHTINWEDVMTLAPVMLLCSIILFIIRYRLQVLTLGDEEAQSLGISVRQIRLISILCATILASSVVAIAGVVSFVGLIVPHMVRMIFGENFKCNFTQSILMGGNILLVSDILARSMFTAEVPVSILTSAIGAVVLVLFISRKNH